MSFIKYILLVVKNFINNVHYLGKFELANVINQSSPSKYADLQKSLFQSKKQIINLYFENNPDKAKKFKKELDFLNQSQEIDPFPYPTIKHCDHICAEFDKENQMPYIVHRGKKLYLPKGWTIEQAIKYYIRFIERENILGGNYTTLSPHQYQSDDIQVEENDIVIDAGAAEGLFALDVIEKAKFVYLFEVEKTWIEALEKTFHPFKDKVKIIQKYLSATDTNDSVCLNTLFSNTSNEVYFIKMDIEGQEEEVLTNSLNFLHTPNKIKISCCTYHKEQHETSIPCFLKDNDFQVEFSDGFMLFYWDPDLRAPFFRKGLVRASKNK